MNFRFFLLDIECDNLPPNIPSDPEYLDPRDDGYVAIDMINYPPGSFQHSVYRSYRNNTELPRNYMANLT